MAKDYYIATKPTATVEQAIEWAKNKKASQLLIDLAPTFWKVATAKGINPVFSFCQTAYETAYMSFKGCLLDESFKNTAGIKRSDSEIKEIMKKNPGHNSSDTVADAHMKFKTWEDSINAQVDHSALYAGLKGYPKKYPSETNDPRHFTWCFGIGKTVLEWAPHYSTHSYGERLVQLMEELNNTKAPVVDKYYRVRKDWKDADSQLGAYLNLDLAIENCPKTHKVYDPNGKQVHPKVTTKPASKPTTKPTTTTSSKTNIVDVTLPELRKGMYKDSGYSEFIATMQQLLIANNISCGESGADGSFGGATDTAVREYQTKNKLTVDGICGIKTWNKLLGN